MTDQERDLYNELTFLFHHRIIQPKEYPALEKLAVELKEPEDPFFIPTFLRRN